ncbi:hypothetical protein [Acinetobacter pittii]|uniref:hypothetical protein n=1 Tax=Acinetobacter pittii TaxID=48296 RepID=UPI00049F7A14|nr:hypothetical protein [Acinetobacter pittii]KCX62688.1 hypothetical protein J541_1542 [Acinetobacter pittii]OTU33719.1 hypothetical protein CAT57_15415 [Acinetobacter pittii]PPB97061.1 hypothetical protein ApiHDV312665_13055 [Acinetobacter pittii]PPC30796.1 hypothetical protein ApiMCR16048_13285 [Acinetobacter pittii]WPP61695.1 hypothetical protein SOI72_11855 [Acinetobacter pittii]
MTVQVTDRLSQLYVGNGVNTRFDFTFRIFDQEDEIGVAVRIKVGNEFEFLDETKYTVTINPDNLGGYVNFLDAPNPQTYFYIAGKTPVDQQLDITNYDNFYPDAIEKALDKLTAILQEWKHLVDFETQARILADLNYDELAQQRETELKAYIDGIASAITGQPVLGLPAKFVVDGAETQKAINDLNIQVVKSKSALEVLKPRIDGQVVLMTGYYENQFQGGDHFKYDKSQSTVNNGVTIINGWVKQFSNTELTVSACGARQGNYDHTAALQLAVSTATSLKRKLIADIDLRVSASTDLSATLNIEGNGGAVQYSRSITAIADVPIFNVKAGFSSESSRFASLMFKASTGGTATAFRSTDNGYLSQCTFDHCVFDRSLRYGIDANIILCDFQKCDFGTYQSAINSVGFKAIRCQGVVGTREPNANTFYNCIFRRGNDDYMIEWDSYGAQWHFFACDFEQNDCTKAIINCTAASPIMFVGGYIESNETTPYFIKTNGNSATGFVPLITFQSVHFNQPALTAIAKNTMANYPKYKFEGCYGQLGCALWESRTGVLNDITLLSSSFGNHFTLISGGSIGNIHTETYPSGYNHYLSRNYVDTSVKRISKLQQTISSGQAKSICTLANKDKNNSYSYGGFINVFAVFGNSLDASGSSATYNLIVNKGSSGQIVTVISKAGDTEGNTSGHPSFSFSLANNILSVTPIGSSGNPSFFASFFIEATGNLSVS